MQVEFLLLKSILIPGYLLVSTIEPSFLYTIILFPFSSFVFIFSFGGVYNISALNFFLFEDEGINPQIIFIKNFLKRKGEI